MNEELLKEKLETHEKRINNHADRLDKLEIHEAARDVKIDNLCDKLEKQTRSIYGLIGIVATARVGFFFYAVQQGQSGGQEGRKDHGPDVCGNHWNGGCNGGSQLALGGIRNRIGRNSVTGNIRGRPARG